MTKVLFRFEADATVGRGHLARCVPLARALRDGGASVSIAIGADSPSVGELVDEDVRLITEPAWPLRRLEEEAAGHDVVVLDMHDVPARTIERLRLHVPVVGLSAVGSDLGHFDLLVNPVAHRALAALELSSDQRPRVLTGSEAVIVDHARFADVRGLDRHPGTALVGLGGGRGHAETVRVIARELARERTVRRTTVCTRDLIEPIDPSVEVLASPTDFPRRLATASVLICGLGTTLYEAASLGTPAVVSPQSDTHERQARWLQEHGFFYLATEGPEEAAGICIRLLGDDDERHALSAAGQRFAKPETVAPIAKEIATLASQASS